MAVWLLILGMAAGSDGCHASLTAILADLDQHPGITWTQSGRAYAEETLSVLCVDNAVATAETTTAPGSAGASADDEPTTIFGVEVRKAPPDSAGQERLKKSTH